MQALSVATPRRESPNGGVADLKRCGALLRTTPGAQGAATSERRGTTLAQAVVMAQDIRADSDENLQEPIDRDALWGPFVCFRPAQDQRFSVLRALLFAIVFGGFYGLALNLIVALCGGGVASLPSVYAIPLLLAATSFVGLQWLLAPVWNRRAHWLKRRQNYLAQLENER